MSSSGRAVAAGQCGPVVAFRDAVVLLDGFPALSGLTITIDPGELVVIRGANGAGKSTLLRTCAGLLAVESGEALVLGHSLAVNRRLVRRHVALLGHAGFLYDDLTVEDNVRFAAWAHHASPHAVDGALAKLGLDGRLRKLKVGACSFGQRRRVALASVVVRNPPLWLLDEPHAGLDADSREVLDSIVREAVGNGATVVLASHDEERAATLASRTVVVAGGHLIGDSVSYDAVVL